MSRTAEAAAVRASVSSYLGVQPPSTRRVLRAVRTIVREAVPDAVEVFSYGIPGFRYLGEPLAWYAGWTSHVSLYPLTPGMRRALGAGATRYAIGKGTVRFPLDEPVPMSLVRRLVRARAAEIRATLGTAVR